MTDVFSVISEYWIGAISLGVVRNSITREAARAHVLDNQTLRAREKEEIERERESDREGSKR